MKDHTTLKVSSGLQAQSVNLRLNVEIGYGEQIYHVERMILESKKIFPDREHIIYVNGSYKDESGSALGDLIHDFFCENPADMRYRQLAKRVEFLKDNKRGGRKMCKIIEDLQNESKKETLLESIRNLMKNLNLTLQQAMDALDLPRECLQEKKVI